MALTYAVRVSRRARRITIRVAADGAVEVTVPPRGTRREAEAFVAAQRAWIGRTQTRLLAQAAAHPPFPYLDGATLAVLGEPAALRVDRESGRVRAFARVRPGAVEVRVPAAAGRDEVRRAIRRAVGGTLGAFARRRLERHARALRATVRRLKVGEFRSQWGSCTARGAVALDWRLALGPPALAEYVIAHEAVHLKVGGHPPRFWRVLESLLPGSAERRRELRARSRALLAY